MNNLFKNISKLFVLTLAVAMVSCGGDDEVVAPVGPTLTVTPTNAAGSSFNVGDQVEISFSFTAPGEISGFNYSGFLNEGLADEVTLTKQFISPTTLNLASNTEGTFTINFEVSAEFEGKAVSFTFEVVDKNNQIATGSYNYTASVAVDSYTQILIGGFQNSTLGSFYNAVDNIVYNSNDAQTNGASVDLLFYYADTPGYTIAAVDNAEAEITIGSQTGGSLTNITPQNATRFKTYTAAPDFDTITSSTDLSNAHSADTQTTGESRVTTLAVGDIFGFTLDVSRGSKLGLVKVISIDGTSGTDRAIQVEVKIQK